MAPLTDAFAADELRQQPARHSLRAECLSLPSTPMACGWRTGAYAPPEWCRVTGVQPDSRLAAQSGVLCQRGSWSTVDGLLAAGDQRHRRMLRNSTARPGGWWVPRPRQAEVLADRLCGAPGETLFAMPGPA
ncbi:hypothetical protein MJ584_16820 [Klebsiella pneumoniae]|nr:hypothetical protein MJ584_16820 [Klebsiella pneumoniae]